MSAVSDVIQPDVFSADGVLPADCVPDGPVAATTRRVFLTGATGFLGRYLLAELLRETRLEIVCLVRAANINEGMKRIVAALAAAGFTSNVDVHRLEVVTGDVAMPYFGLEPQRYLKYARAVDAIYHCAAEVNWIKSYRQLRASNVTGTLNVIRFACSHHAKPVQFVSTLAVCYAVDSPSIVNERSDMLAHFSGMPLGYAQSKCIAESLFRQAAARGVPVRIVRSGLICGDARSGVSNEQDLISRLLRASITSGCAADVDWQLDCCPVDYVAHALVTLGKNAASGIVHLHHHEPRHWRELVLWLNFIGYPIKLISLDAWLAMLQCATPQAQPDLYALRPFFLARPKILRGGYLPELYLETSRSRICSDVSHQMLAAQGLAVPLLDAGLLERYFRRYVQSGFVPSPSKSAVTIEGRQVADEDVLRCALRQRLGDKFDVLSSEPLPLKGANSILGELCASKSEQQVGLRRYRIYVSPDQAGATLDVVLKMKPSDAVLVSAGATLAHLCNEKLGHLFVQYQDCLDSNRAHLREVALHANPHPTLAPYMPLTYGTFSNSASGQWAIVSEYLRDVEWPPLNGDLSYWNTQRIDALSGGLAAIHAAWFHKENELLHQPWLARNAQGAETLRMLPFLVELNAFAAKSFNQWLAEPCETMQRDFLESMPQWQPSLRAMPQTLIHNDFNPRNFVLRPVAGELKLCAFDWELATVGVPQHDLAELLCFILPVQADHSWAATLVERQRKKLQALTGYEITQHDWQRGFALSLRYLLIQRFALYAMIDKFKPQPFLPYVIRNWYRLIRWFDAES